MATKTKKLKKRLILLDAHAIIHRAYHALPDFSTKDGIPTGALYGISAMLMKIIDELKPDYIIACYDLPGGTFRDEIYENYKAGRAKAEDDLIDQIKRSREIFDAFGIPYYEMKGFEADDLLGTIVDKITQLPDYKNVDIVIASGDMDTLQLVSKKRVQVYTLRKGLTDTVLYDERGVEDRFGFSPTLLPDYKGLRGDPSDNIPGIRGIGEKTATQLITTFGSIEEIYIALKKNRNLFEKAGIKDRIITLLQEGEEEALFSKTLGRIRRDAPISFSLPPKEWGETMNTQDVVNLFYKFEFRSLADRYKKMFGIQESQIDIKENENISDQAILETGIALWVLNSEMTNPSFDDILQYGKTESFTSVKEKIFKELQKTNLQQIFSEIEKPIINIVSEMEKRGVCIDTDYLKKLSVEYHKTLDKMTKEIFKQTKKEFNINSPKQLSEILFDTLGLPTKGVKRSATGYYSTNISVLDNLITEHPVIDAIIQYRELKKLLSTYIDVIPNMTDKDGRLHARFIQHGTTTGRFASNNPNLQNIPIRTDLGRAIRGAFRAPKGSVLLALDYSQIELRVLAILSRDPILIKIFKEGKDVHSSVASYVFEVSEENVTSEMRRVAKIINFGIIYGMGINALRKNLGPNATKEEAQQFHNTYFKKFPNIQAYLDGQKAFARKYGYTETLFGRQRNFPAISSHIPYIRASAEREATNAPLQGTAADIIKLAIQFVEKRLQKEGLRKSTHLVMQIHDELIYEVETENLEKAKHVIVEEMEQVIQNSFIKFDSPIPLSVKASHGSNWNELE